jgi:hypothetical protein
MRGVLSTRAASGFTLEAKYPVGAQVDADLIAPVSDVEEFNGWTQEIG